MIMLAACIRDHWHAVERDLLDLGYRADDIGVNLSVCELISIVVAAQPGTAVHYSDRSRWSRTDELIANLSEQQAGLVDLNARYARPEVDSAPVRRQTEMDSMPNYMGVALQPMPVDEFTVKLKERQRMIREGKK